MGMIAMTVASISQFIARKLKKLVSIYFIYLIHLFAAHSYWSVLQQQHLPVKVLLRGNIH